MDRASLTGSSSNAAAQDSKIAKFFVRNELALHLATKRGDDIEVERLLAFGRADVNETDRHGQTALHIAAFEGFTAVVDILIRKGIAIGSLDKNRWSPLHAASKEGHLAICERLLLEGADPTVPSSSGTTPFLYLVAHPCSDLLLFVMHLMLKRGADPNAANEHGLTPLHNACLRAGEGNVLFLLQNGADVNAADKFGEYPLHVACRTGKKRVAQLLINYGALLTTKGPDGTPEETARKYTFNEVADFIAALRLDPAKVMGKKKSSKSMKKKLAAVGRVNSSHEDDGHDSSRGSGTESTGTADGDDAVTKSKSVVDSTSSQPKDGLRRSKKGKSKPNLADPNSGYATEASSKPSRSHGPRRVASAIHHPMVQENPSPAKLRTKRSSSGGAAAATSVAEEEPVQQKEPPKEKTKKPEEPPAVPKKHTLDPVSEQSSEGSTAPSPSITPAVSAVDLSSLDTIAESESASEKPTDAPLQGEAEPIQKTEDPSLPPADDTDVAYSDIASPRTTSSAPVSSSRSTLSDTTQAANAAVNAAVTHPSPSSFSDPNPDVDEEFIPFGPRRIQQHSTGVRQQKAAAAVAAVKEATADKRRTRSIKIESLLKFFESTGGDVRGGTLPTKSATSPQSTPVVAKKASRQLSAEGTSSHQVVSPRKESGGATSLPATPHSSISRNSNVDSASANRAHTRDTVKHQDVAPVPLGSKSSPTITRVGDSRRATVGDVNQIRQMFSAQGLSFDQMMSAQQGVSPRALAMSGAGSSDEESRKKNSNPKSTDPKAQTSPRPVPSSSADPQVPAEGVPPIPTLENRSNEPLSGSSSPRTPINRSSNSIQSEKKTPGRQSSESEDDSESDSEDTEDVTAQDARQKGSLSGSKDDSVIPTRVTIPAKPNPLKKGGSKDTMITARPKIHGMAPTRVDSSRLYGFKQIQPTVISQATTVSSSKPSDIARAVPFSLHLKQINFETLLAIPEIPSPVSHKQHKDDIVIPNAEFSAEFGRSGDKPAPSTLFAEDTEFTTPHYWDNFFSKEADAGPLKPDGDVSEAAQSAVPHFNFVGALDLAFYPAGEPIIISCIQKGDMILGLVRTRAGDATFHMEWPSDKRAKHASVLRLMLENNSQLKDAKLVRVKDPQLIAELLDYERVEKNQFKRISQHKIGILYVKEGQTTEEAVLGNRSGSERFEDFLKFLGRKIELQGYEGFDGGLDTKKDRCGKYSIMARWLEFEIMFHVSTYIPLGSGEEKLIARKKYIGNDMTCLVFLDGETTKFDPPLISGDFLHNFLVVKPDATDSNTFTVNVAMRHGVPPFGPPVPKHGSFKRSEQFHDWLLSKLVNAERATLNSTQFISKRRLARQKLLGSLVDTYRQK
eukprot:TRINITY_DN428_c1_g1_i1.p1 TRINITY_DN428_c1_g1~~TRINITY_DN428_c1_g1_i1.p1  ORF type:complete len:1357 (+),score=281.76 TRINITY_DN428_c1_g1_i1:175-4245(+)